MYELIKKYEGLKLDSYLCPNGIASIGYGTTIMDGTAVKLGMTITKEKAEELLIDYIDKEIKPRIEYLHLKGKQEEALISLIYNIGVTKFMRSNLKVAIENNDYEAICREWDFGFQYHHLKGMYKRRTEELYWFISEI